MPTTYCEVCLVAELAIVDPFGLSRFCGGWALVTAQVEKMKKRVAKTLSQTRFAGAPMVVVSANPRVDAGRGTGDGSGGGGDNEEDNGTVQRGPPEGIEVRLSVFARAGFDCVLLEPVPKQPPAATFAICRNFSKH